MTIVNRNASKIHESEQEVLNQSFDLVFKVLATLGLGYDGQNVVRQEANDQQTKLVESGEYLYICKSAVGTAEATAKWKIFRIDSLGSKVYADGNANYDNVATDPTALTYTYA